MNATDVGESRFKPFEVHFYFRCHFCGTPTRMAPIFPRLSESREPDRRCVYPSACFDCTTHDDGRYEAVPTNEAAPDLVLSAEDTERCIRLRRGDA